MSKMYSVERFLLLSKDADCGIKSLYTFVYKEYNIRLKMLYKAGCLENERVVVEKSESLRTTGLHFKHVYLSELEGRFGAYSMY